MWEVSKEYIKNIHNAEALYDTLEIVDIILNNQDSKQSGGNIARFDRFLRHY
jgi:hypothetical protein